MGTKVFDNALDLITFSRASGGTALRRVGYGDELVTNGTFDTDVSGWLSGSGATFASISGQLVVTNPTGGTNRRAYQGFSTVVGKAYLVTADIVSGGRIGIGTSSAAQDIVSTDSSVEFIFTANATTTFIKASVISPTGGDTATFDNISVKEVIFDRASDPLVLFNHPTNIPRIEYAADSTVKGLLIEEARTNLVAQSNEFTAATGEVTKDVIGLDGQVSAWTLENPNSNAARIDLPVTVSTSTTYTASIFAKQGTTNVIYLSAVLFTTPANGNVWFDLDAGIVGIENSGITGAISHIADGWYKCSITFTTDSVDTSGQIRISVSKGNGQTTADAGDNVLIYGAQFEEGSFPTSYIPTSGSTATRSADTASIPVADFGVNQSKYSMLLEATNLAPDNGVGTGNNTNAIVEMNTPPLANYSSLGIGSSSTRINRPSLASRSNGGIIVAAGDLIALENTFDENLSVKFAASFDVDSGTIAGSVNGSAVFSATGDVAGVALPFTDLTFGKGQGAAYIKSIQYYPRRLTNAQLQELTQ